MKSKTTLSLQQAIDGLASGELNAQQLSEDALQRIKQPQGEGNAVFTQVYEAWAKQQAEASLKRRRRDDPNHLARICRAAPVLSG